MRWRMAVPSPSGQKRQPLPTPDGSAKDERRPKMNEQCSLPTRQRLLEQIAQLARRTIHGTLSESYRARGNRAAAVTLKAPSTGRT
jgi:hypothetical protein